NAFWDHVAEREGDMNPHRMAFTQIVCVANDEAEAERDYYDAVKYFYKFANRVPVVFTGAPGYRTARTMRWEAEHREASPDRARAYNGEMSFSEYNDKGYIIAGSPATVADRIRDIAKQLRIGQIIATPTLGNLPEETARKNTILMGTEVIPKLR